MVKYFFVNSYNHVGGYLSFQKQKSYKLLEKMWEDIYFLHKPDWTLLDKFWWQQNDCVCILIDLKSHV